MPDVFKSLDELNQEVLVELQHTINRLNKLTEPAIREFQSQIAQLKPSHIALREAAAGVQRTLDALKSIPR
ncbi:MAG: hypothetical protein IH991_23760 [Planctomycetes bacterium]|nr:hypothetical protein [Planctomycetota bacterium]